MIRPEIKLLKEKILNNPEKWYFHYYMRDKYISYNCDDNIPCFSNMFICLDRSGVIIDFNNEEIEYLSDLFGEFFDLQKNNINNYKTKQNLNELSVFLNKI